MRHGCIIERQSASMTWKMAEETALRKFKEKQSVGKVTIFWDHTVLQLKYCQKGSNVGSASYLNTLICLQKVVKSKCPSLLKRKVLLHDNVTPHLAKLTQSLFNQLKWDVFHHPTYSPDLALSDNPLSPVYNVI